jgi:hypothetical protein
MAFEVDIFDQINMLFDDIAFYNVGKSLFNLFYDLARYGLSIIADAV